jgi:two-component system sensor histidine kinase TctE
LPCEGHPLLLHQALLNLAHNAIEHGRPNGVVTLSAQADTQGWTLAVEDDGPGLPPEVLARLGQRFAKGRHSQGSGLGMAIALSVVEGHGGRLAIETVVPGPGTRATLWWPR